MLLILQTGSAAGCSKNLHMLCICVLGVVWVLRTVEIVLYIQSLYRACTPPSHIISYILHKRREVQVGNITEK